MPHWRSRSTLASKAGCWDCASLRNGIATTGRPLPIASVNKPRASVSLMPAAHLITYSVRGVTSRRGDPVSKLA